MNSGNRIGFGFLLLFLGFAIFFLFRPFAYAIAIAAIITIGIVSLWYLIAALSKAIRKFRLRNTLEGILEEKLENIGKLTSKLKSDLKVISQELNDVETRLEDQTLSEFAKEKLHHLKDAFQKEEQLKTLKLEFYETTGTKFNALLSDHKVLEDISKKKGKLSNSSSGTLPDDQMGDSILSEDKEIIEDLDFLLHKMKYTEQLIEAQEIKKELVELYR